MSFPDPVHAFDIHVYFFQNSQEYTQKAYSLRQKLIQNFPSLRIYDLINRPVGPHATGMFQAVVTSPLEFGQVVPFVMLHRDGLSVLVHPHTGDPVKDHTDNAIWIGEKLPVNLYTLH